MSETKDTPDMTRHSTFGSESEEERQGRDRWPSRTAFYLAAVGSAVGFGNVWRFPALAKDYGGGAFFIPYLMALFLIGIPTLMLEISLGQVYQSSCVGAFGAISPRMRGIGIASAVCAFFLVTYYAMLLSWVTNAFFDSFTDSAPWDEEGTTGQDAVDYFFNEIIGMSTLGDDLRPTRVVGANVGYNALVWFCIWLCLAFGAEWTGRIAYITMGLPILFLFLFFFKAILLEGASDGIEEYIGKWDMAVLREEADVWSTAVSQIFFSIGVTMGVMTAYGSHCPRGEPATLNSTVISLANSSFSFIAGFAVFAAMGHLSHLQGIPVDEIPYGGFSLVFGTWPVVFGTFEGGIHWVRLLFINLFLLGVDSGFSILESPVCVFTDWFHSAGINIPQWAVSGIGSLICFLIGIVYATDAGLIFLDAVDYYINFVLLIIGLMETFAAGWMFRLDKQIETLGKKITMTYMIGTFVSVLAAACIWFGSDGEKDVLGGFLALIVGYLATHGLTYVFANEKIAEEPDKWDTASIWYEITMGNVMDLRDELQSVCGWIPTLWAFMMKHFIPQVLLVLFINGATADNGAGKPKFGNYEGYVTWPYQVLGIFVVCLAWVLFCVGIFAPNLYKHADLPAMQAEQGGDEDKLGKQESSDGAADEVADA